MSNRVQDDDPVDPTKAKRKKKGTGDDRLQEMAENVVEQYEKVKKEAASSAKERKQLYSKEALLPTDILKNIPYKQTHEALREGDIDKLKKLLCSFVIVMS